MDDNRVTDRLEQVSVASSRVVSVDCVVDTSGQQIELFVASLLNVFGDTGSDCFTRDSFRSRGGKENKREVGMGITDVLENSSPSIPDS